MSHSTNNLWPPLICVFFFRSERERERENRKRIFFKLIFDFIFGASSKKVHHKADQICIHLLTDVIDVMHLNRFYFQFIYSQNQFYAYFFYVTHTHTSLFRHSFIFLNENEIKKPREKKHTKLIELNQSKTNQIT